MGCDSCWVCLGLLAMIWEGRRYWWSEGKRGWNPAFFFHQQGGSYGAVVELRESTKSISFCLRALVQYLQYTCNLNIVLDGMRMQHMSISWNFNFVWRLTLDLPSCQNHWFVSAWLQCSKPMLVYHNPCRCLIHHVLLCVLNEYTEENSLFDLSLHMRRQQTTDNKIRGEAGGRTPVDLHLPVHGFVRCSVLHRELHHCQAGFRQTSLRLDYSHPFFFARSQPSQPWSLFAGGFDFG